MSEYTLDKIINRVERFTAFVDGALEGNPAGICLLDGAEEFPAADLMQEVARVIGYSETAFVKPLPGQGCYEIRYFTPKIEVDLCGHATLAAGYALSTAGGDALEFRAKGGELSVVPTGADGLVWMDFPAEPPPLAIPDQEAARFGSALGLGKSPAAWRGRFDVMVRLASANDVFRCRPSALELAELDARGVMVTAPAPDGTGAAFDFVSRYFAPRAGIAEDPVTGSAHCLLGPYWAAELGRERLAGYQASDRGGLVQIEVRGGGRIGLGGRVRELAAAAGQPE